MLNLLKICIALWSFHQVLGKVGAQCTLRFTNIRPLVFKQFGTKVILLRQSLDVFTLYEGESIATFCSNGFVVESKDISKEYKNIIWKCHSKQLESNSFRKNEVPFRYYYDMTIGCQTGIRQKMYESETHLPDCMTTSTMLVVGAHMEPYARDIKTAAFCYDLDKLQLKFVAYTAYNTKQQNYSKVIDPFNVVSDSVIDLKVNELDTLGLDQELLDFNTYFNFMSGDQFNAVKNIQRSYDFELFSPDWFEYDSLIQDIQLAGALEPYKNAFSIVWYTKLLYGNWKYFLNALSDHVTDNINKYEVRLGTSDHIEVPSSGICNITKPLVFTFKNTESNYVSEAKAPKYIWAHFRALPVSSVRVASIKQTATENFVIIGFNSPYILTTEMNSFCDNICHQFPWLAASQFGKLHMRPFFGVVICCRAADVAHKLHNFPSNDIWWQSDDGRDTTSTTEKSSALALTKVTNGIRPILPPEFSAENSIGSGNDFHDYNDDTE